MSKTETNISDETFESIPDEIKDVIQKKSPKNVVGVPLLPLRDVVIFPGMIIPLFVGRPKSVAALEAGMEGDKRIVLVAQKKMDVDNPSKRDLYSVGTLVNILQLLKLPDGSIKVLVEGLERLRIVKLIKAEPYFTAKTTPIRERQETSAEIQALLRHVNELFENYVKLNRKVPQETLLSIINMDDPGRLADSISAHISVKVSEKQRLLASPSPTTRLKILTQILSNELEILELEQKIKSEVRKQMEQSQKEYYLHEQIKAIQRELGKDSEGSEEKAKYLKRIKSAKMSKEAEERTLEELDRLETMPPLAPEATVVRNYLDWLCDNADINNSEVFKE